MLSAEDFRQITFEDRPFFMEFQSRYPPEHSDYIFSTMVCWQHYMRYSYARNHDSVIIMTEHEGEIRFRPPMGPKDRTTLEEVIRLSREINGENSFSVVDPEMKDWLQAEFPNMEFQPQRDYFDYVYLAKDLAELSGKRYLKIRNQLNYFLKHNTYSAEEISKENIAEAREFLVKWCLQKGCVEEPLLNSERIAVQTALANFTELGLSGLIIRINGIVEAFSVFEKMSNDTAVVHFEKANFTYKGIYQAINRETAKFLVNDFKFINRETDMGIKGLRKAKEKYHPHHFVEVYHV
ncbi:MAG: phosphatidylglycerol lysyltransferase domain-containing protein [Candidatus Thermoplasmatota archaeon]|jgi:hypothetical protein|nr:phosphatidylglycerol lysyltransferase domain-containing protein [Candidatus Thermoplasmatota archaeon]